MNSLQERNVADDDNRSGEPVFLDTAAARDFLGRPAHRLEAFLDLVETRAGTMLDVEDEAFHLWHFMPTPSYEYAVAMRIAAGQTYRPPFPLKPDALLSLRREEAGPGAVEIAMGGSTIAIAWEPGKPARITCGDASLKTRDIVLNLSCRVHEGTAYLAVNGRRLMSSEAGSFSDDCMIDVGAGAICLLQAQTSDGRGHFLFFDNLDTSPGTTQVEFLDERNPFRFNWGLRSIRMYNTFVALAVVHDLVRTLDADGAVADPLHRRLRDIDGRFAAMTAGFLDQYLKWPRWRPGVGDFPEIGVWDRNSFTNGVIPAAVAVLARMHDRRRDPEVLANFRAKGAGFLGSALRAGFLTRTGAFGDGHWLKRSANHGLLELTNIVIAARLLGQDDDETIRAIHTSLGNILHRLHEDGSFCEGVPYDFFGMQHYVVYRALFPDVRYDEGRSAGTLDRLFADTHDWIALSCDNRGRIFANFGDNFGTTTRSSYWWFLRQFSQNGLAIPREDPSVDEFYAFVPAAAEPARKPDRLVARLYPRTGFALAAAHDDDGTRTSGLFIIGSKHQKTHNHNHDCGGFTFYMGESRVTIDKSARQSHRNNTIGYAGDDGYFEPAERRTYNGSVAEKSRDASGVVFTSSVSYNQTFSAEGIASKMTRQFDYRPEQATKLVVHTRVQSAGGRIPFLSLSTVNFDFEAGGENDAWVACFAKTGKAWTRLPVQQGEGFVFFQADAYTNRRRGVSDYLIYFGSGPALPTADQAEADAARFEGD